ncbi:MAG TPA: SMP-30/gluconolactonase/LRE family protein [Acidimicrobiia bacterium]|jgi:gluconolactonase
MTRRRGRASKARTFWALIACAAGSVAVSGYGAAAHAAATNTAWTCPSAPFGNPVPSGAAITRLPDALPNDAYNNYGTLDANVEGPVWRNGSLYVSEFGGGPNPEQSRIVKITNGIGTVFNATAGTNGLAVGPAGALYGASQTAGGIVRFAGPSDPAAVVAGKFLGQRFNSPNDLTIRNDGTIYFTDPTYQAPQPAPQARTRVYRVAPQTHAVSVIDDNKVQPNGITLSPDEKSLYLATTNGLYKYAVAANGSVGTAVRFASQVPAGDGMAVDCAGNLYVADTNVVVVAPGGRTIAQLRMPAGGETVTNVAFGGSDHRTLFITAMGPGNARGVYQVKLKVPGLPY